MSNATTDTGKAGMGDIAEIFYAPSAVFARRTDGKFAMPYVALVLLGIVIFLATKGLIQPVIDAEIARSIGAQVASGKIPPERVEAATSIARTAGTIIPFILYLVGPFLSGLLIWIFGKLAKVDAIGTIALVVGTFSFFPRLVGGIVGAVFAAMIPDGAPLSAASISVSPARFVDVAAHPALATILGRFDLFVLWGIVLIAIGVERAGKATKGQAWATAIGVWSIPTLFAIWGAVRSS